MRFHVGFSFRPSLSWLKWIGLGIIALLAFFGIGNHVVLAAEAGSYNYSPSSVVVHNYDTSADHNLSWTSTNSGALGGNGAYARFSNCTTPGGTDCAPVYNGYVDYSYSAHDFCSTSDKVTITTRYYTRTSTPPTIFPTNNFQTVNPVRLNSRSFDSSNNVWIISFTIPDNSSFKLRLGFENDYNTYYPFVSSSVRISMQYNCEYSLEQSTSDIINNSNNNTQQIIDSQNDINNNLTDDTIDNSTLNNGDSFFSNFSTNSNSGFRGIVTAPIRVFQEMINNNACTPLRLSLSMSDGNASGSNDLSVPCGNILWDLAPGSVVSIWHTLICGVILYRLLLDLVRFVNNLLNPESTKEYLMDL